MAVPDLRRMAWRSDLAAASLKGKVDAPRFVEPQQARVCQPVLDILDATDARGLATQAIWGETLDVFDTQGGWSWVQCHRDGYVGYARADGLTAPGPDAETRIRAIATHLYPQPDIKTRPLATLPWGSCCHVTDTKDGFATVAEGFLPVDHIEPSGTRADDWVAVAEGMLGLPYLWGGRSVFGLDCSGLVQMSCHSAGIDCPRDSDMQAAELGEALDPSEPLRRGDVIFWHGHVGVMREAETLLHATMFRMAVMSEPLSVTTERIAAGGNGPVTIRRRIG